MNTLTRKQIEHIRADGPDHVYGSVLNALCDMARAYLDAQEWRPIETAPRDGTQILLYCEGREAWTIGFWLEPRGDWTGIYDTFTPDRPIAWLPLPAPPQQKERP